MVWSQVRGSTIISGNIWYWYMILGNKRNRNLPAETRNFPKPKFGSGFVPAHFQASWFRFRYLVLKFLDFLVIQEVLPWIPGLTRNFLVKPRTSWLTQEILGESCEESLPNQIFAKKYVCFLVIFSSFWPRRLHYKDQKVIFECVYYIFCILQRV